MQHHELQLCIIHINPMVKQDYVEYSPDPESLQINVV